MPRSHKDEPLKRRDVFQPYWHRGMNVKNWDDDHDYRNDAPFKEGKEEIKRFLANVKICTYGSLGVRYANTNFIHLLDSILDDLEAEGYRIERTPLITRIAA
jgi:hypothetical protein